MRSLLLVPLLFGSACGITIGVDAYEGVHQAQHPSAGIELLSARDLRVRDNVVLSGEASEVRAAVETTQWTSGAAEEVVVEPILQASGSTLSFAIAGADERLTVSAIELAVPSDMAALIEVKSGDFEAHNLTGELGVQSDGLARFENCVGPINVTASSAIAQSEGDLDIAASNSLTASLGGSGLLSAKEINLSLDAIGGPISASTEGSGGGRISLFVPKGESFTLILRAKVRGFADLDDFRFDSSDPELQLEGEDITQGIEVDINGGGPRIDLSAEGSVFVYNHADG